MIASKECPNCGSTEFKTKVGKYGRGSGAKVQPNSTLGCGVILILFAIILLVVNLITQLGGALLMFAIPAIPGVIVLLIYASMRKNLGMLTEYTCKECKYYWEIRDGEILLEGKYSSTQRVEARLKAGIVFIPQGKPYRFPDYCVKCMGPSTETKQLEDWVDRSHTDTDFLARKVTTTSSRTTTKITGIPYCAECAKKWNPGIKMTLSEKVGHSEVFEAFRFWESLGNYGVYLTFKNKEYAKKFLEENNAFQS